MESYHILCFSIKWRDVDLLQSAIREMAIILQAPSTEKPKYLSRRQFSR